MAEAHAIEYRTPAPARRGFVGLPHAAIRVAQHDDGRWMFAFTFTTSVGGEGFSPLPKWGRFADNQPDAIAAGVAEFLERISARTWADNPQAKLLREWAEGIAAPSQGALFA
jgi:hypothetical protein